MFLTLKYIGGKTNNNFNIQLKKSKQAVFHSDRINHKTNLFGDIDEIQFQENKHSLRYAERFFLRE